MSFLGTIRVMRMFARAAGRLPAGHLWYLLGRMRNERPHRFDGQVRINTFFPPYPSAAFDRFLSAVIDRRRVPLSTYLAVTGDCPYRCGHCSYGGRPKGHLPTGQVLAIIGQVRSIGTCTLGLTGGEPLLRDDLEELVAFAAGKGTGSEPARCWPARCLSPYPPLQPAASPPAAAHREPSARSPAVAAGGDRHPPRRREPVPARRHGGRDPGPMATLVFTTGHGLTPRRAARLAEAGLTCLTVGIEAADPAAHDAVRGVAGSFEQARQTVTIAREAGIYTAVSTVGTRERLASGELERMYDLAAQWGAGEFRLLAPVATGSAAACGAFMLSDAERRTLYDFHVRHNRRRGRGPAVASFAYLESADMFGCGAGYHHLFIDAAGEACPCDLTPLSFGNVTQEPLAEIWRRMGTPFATPRCSCLMGELAGKLGQAPALPLPRERSEQLCAACAEAHPLPECYRRLLR